MADKKTTEATKDAKAARDVAAEAPQTVPMAMDAEGEVRPLGDIQAEAKAGKDEVVVLDHNANPVARPQTAAEKGEDTSKEDHVKFIPPTAPSNAPQPESYVDGVRTGTEEEDAAAVKKIALAAYPEEEEDDKKATKK